MLRASKLEPAALNIVHEPPTVDSLVSGKADAIVTYGVSAQARAHAPEYIERVRSLCSTGGGYLDPDTYLVAGYWDILAPSGRSTPESAATTAAVNEALRAAAEDSGMDYVDLASAFAASGDVAALISDDGLHPNAEGIRVIGEALAAAHP